MDEGGGGGGGPSRPKVIARCCPRTEFVFMRQKVELFNII